MSDAHSTATTPSESTETEARQPGAAPTGGQAPTSESDTTDPQANPTSADLRRAGHEPKWSKEIDALRQEAASRRIALKERDEQLAALQSQLAQMQAAQQQAEQQVLAEQGKWQELAEARQAEIDKTRQRYEAKLKAREAELTEALHAKSTEHDALVKTLRATSLKAAITSQMPGHLKPEQREAIADLIKLRTEIEYDEATHQPTTDFAPLVTEAITTLGLPLEAQPQRTAPISRTMGRPTSNPAADTKPTQASPRMAELQATIDALNRHRRR